MAKLTQAERIAQMPIEDIIKLKGEEGRKELEKYARTLRSGYKRRVGSFKRRGLVSYAQIAFERSIPVDRNVKSIKDMSRNQLILEIARYQKFFNDTTSTISGINKVNREQDLRIFGVGKIVAGNPIPARTMTKEEREKYWDLYDEFKHQKKGATSKYASENIQKTLAEAFFLLDEMDRPESKDLADPEVNLVGFLDKVEKSLKEQQEEENLRSTPNVYLGRGPFRS